MSKRFSFRLDGLQKFRHFKTNEAKLALGEIARMRHEKQESINDLQRYLDSRELHRATVRAAEWQATIAHVDSVRERIKSLRMELVNLQEIEILRRKELSRTMQDEKVLENLREKKRAEYDHSVLLEEQALMDDIAMRTDQVLQST